MSVQQLPVARSSCAPKSVRWAVIGFGCALLVSCSTVARQMAERREACDTLCQKARTAKNEGWPDHADLLLNEAVRQRPDDLEARRQIAETMWDCGRPQESIAEYKELIQLHPKDARLHQRLAVLSWTVGQQDQAAQAAEQALRLDPTSPEALLVKGRAEVARKEFDNAVATYIRLVRAAPDLIEAKVELAEVHVERGHSRQACALLREVIALPKLSPILKNDAEWKLGLTYASADRWAEAATHLGNSIPNREASSADWRLLVTVMALAGQDATGIQPNAVFASDRQHSEPDNSAWTALRDRLLERGEMIAGAGVSGGSSVPAQNSVIRADFSKTAQARE